MPAVAAKLYTPEILTLAVELARFPIHDELDLRGSARSRTCGSLLELACNTDDSGRIAGIGVKVTACAIGQASAALFAQAAAGTDRANIAEAQAQIETWLGHGGPLPDWRGIDILTPALPHRGRHEAILLPWKAAMAALSKPRAPS